MEQLTVISIGCNEHEEDANNGNHTQKKTKQQKKGWIECDQINDCSKWMKTREQTYER